MTAGVASGSGVQGHKEQGVSVRCNEKGRFPCGQCEGQVFITCMKRKGEGGQLCEFLQGGTVGQTFILFSSF